MAAMTQRYLYRREVGRKRDGRRGNDGRGKGRGGRGALNATLREFSLER